MKYVLNHFVLTLLAAGLLGGSALAQTRIGTVDLKKVFDNYGKTKQASQVLEERKRDIEKEDNNMKEDLKRNAKEYEDMLAGLNDQAVSPEERDRRKKAAEDKLKSLREQQNTLEQYERQAAITLREQSARLRNNILNEIKNVLNAKAKAAGYTLVIDTAAETVNNTPVILYSTDENDLTDAVLSQINAAQTAGPADEKAPAAGDKKK